MTDRFAGFVVTLDKDIREDDAEDLQRALATFRHVLRVTTVVSDPALTIAEMRIRREMQEKFFAFYRSTFEREPTDAR